MKRVLILLADGFEEIEAITSIDLLRRAGMEVIIAGIDKLEVTGAHQLVVKADQKIPSKDKFDAVVIPGGMPGATNIAENSQAIRLIEQHYKDKKLIAAICAAPAVVLAKSGILNDRQFTCYPGFEEKISAGQFSTRDVVVSGNVITSRGPGTAIPFAIEIINHLISPEAADQIGDQILY